MKVCRYHKVTANTFRVPVLFCSHLLSVVGSLAKICGECKTKPLWPFLFWCAIYFAHFDPNNYEIFLILQGNVIPLFQINLKWGGLFSSKWFTLLSSYPQAETRAKGYRFTSTKHDNRHEWTTDCYFLYSENIHELNCRCVIYLEVISLVNLLEKIRTCLAPILIQKWLQKNSPNHTLTIELRLP